jgi:putative resolvase
MNLVERARTSGVHPQTAYRWFRQGTMPVPARRLPSGLNGKWTKLKRLLADPQVTVIVVEHRDRLARFGIEHLEAALSAQGRRLVKPSMSGDDQLRTRSMCSRASARDCMVVAALATVPCVR